MSPLLNTNFNGFLSYLKTKKYEHFMIVRDPDSGKVFTSGNGQLALTHLKEQQTAQRRDSGEWLPMTELKKLPMPFSQMVDKIVEVRTYSSVIVQHFMTPKQRLGQVWTNIVVIQNY